MRMPESAGKFQTRAILYSLPPRQCGRVPDKAANAGGPRCRPPGASAKIRDSSHVARGIHVRRAQTYACQGWRLQSESKSNSLTANSWLHFLSIATAARIGSFVGRSPFMVVLIDQLRGFVPRFGSRPAATAITASNGRRDSRAF
jgi:hypothetical protein